MTKQESINSFIDEKIFQKYGVAMTTDYCNSWEAFGRLWEKMKENDDFQQYIMKEPYRSDGIFIDMRLVNPYRFADAVARFYGWKEEKDAEDK